MDAPTLHEMLTDLAEPAAYPFSVDAVSVEQTHISIVFLAGDFVYKVKKPVQLGFLDFSTLDRRRHFCEEEVRLNRRLAPDVYLGVVPITRQNGSLRFEGEGPLLEWAVKMRRLPHEATLKRLVESGRVEAAALQALAERLARFHAEAARGAAIAQLGRFDAVAANLRENFWQTAGHIGVTVDRAVYERARHATEVALNAAHDLIETRAKRGVPCDTHGDLHLDHAYRFPDRAPPGDWVIIDCIEFNERFRYADPIADIAFLAMDLACHGRRDLATAFLDAYLAATSDAEGRALVPLYVSYRALVRAKVEGMELNELEIPQEERSAARERAQAHWLLALGELEPPERRPALVLIGGLPGTGKSTLARELATRSGFELLRTDVVRKELAGIPPEASARTALDTGIYDPAWTTRTYDVLADRASALLHQGKRVVVDASFRSASMRTRFLDLGRRSGIRTAFIACHADPDIVRCRLETRRGDASDADWAVAEQLTWEPVHAQRGQVVAEIDTGDGIAESWNRLESYLKNL